MQSLQQLSEISASVAKSGPQTAENSEDDAPSSSASHNFGGSNEYQPDAPELDHNHQSAKLQRGLISIMKNKHRKLALLLGLQKRSSSNQSLQKAAIAGATITSLVPAVGMACYLPDKEQNKQISASDQQLSCKQKQHNSSTPSTPIHSTMSSPSCSFRMKKSSATKQFNAATATKSKCFHKDEPEESKYQSDERESSETCKLSKTTESPDRNAANSRGKKPKTNMALNVLQYLLQVPGYNQQQAADDRSEGSLTRRKRSVSYDEMRLRQEIGNENSSWHLAATKTISDQSSKRSDFNNNLVSTVAGAEKATNDSQKRGSLRNKHVPETDKEELSKVDSTLNTISNVISSTISNATTILADPSVIGSLLVKEKEQMSKKKRKSDLRLNLTTLEVSGPSRNRSRSFDDRSAGLIAGACLNARANQQSSLLSPNSNKIGLDMIKKRSGSISALQIPKWKLFVRRSSSSSSGRASLSASALNLSSPSPLDRCVHCSLLAEQKTIEHLVKSQQDAQQQHRNSISGGSSSKKSSLDAGSLNNEKYAITNERPVESNEQTDDETATANSSPLKSRKSGAADKRMMKFHVQASRSYSSHTTNSEDDCCLISPEIGLPLVTLSLAQDNKAPAQTVNACSNPECPFFGRTKLCSNLNCPNLFNGQEKSADSTPSTASTTIATSDPRASDEKIETNTNLKDDKDQITANSLEEESAASPAQTSASSNLCTTANLLSPLSASSLNTINRQAKESRIFTFSSIETATTTSSANQTPSSSNCSNFACPNYPSVICESQNKQQPACPNKLRLMQETLAQAGDSQTQTSNPASGLPANKAASTAAVPTAQVEEQNDGQLIVSLEVPVLKQSRSASIDASFLQVPQLQLLRNNMLRNKHQAMNYSTSELDDDDDDDEEEDSESITCKTQRSHSVDIQLPIRPDGQYFVFQTNNIKPSQVFEKYV